MMPRYGRRPRIGASNRARELVAWHEARAEAEAEAEAGAEGEAAVAG